MSVWTSKKKSLVGVLMGLAICGFVTLSGCHIQFVNGFSFSYTGETAEKTENSSFGAELTKLSLDNRFGDVTIESVSEGFGWTWDLKVWAETADEATLMLDLIELKVVKEGNDERLRLEIPDECEELLRGLKSNLTLRVPASVASDIENRHGNSAISGLHGRTIVEQAHGDLELNNVIGETEVVISHGSLTAANVGTLTAECRHGNASLSNIEGTLDLEVAHGTVKANVIQGDVEISSRHGNVKLSGVAGDADVSSQHGNIQIVLPEGAAVNVQAEASHGNVSSEFESDTSSGQTLNLKARHGNVTVKKQ